MRNLWLAGTIAVTMPCANFAGAAVTTAQVNPVSATTLPLKLAAELASKGKEDGVRLVGNVPLKSSLVVGGEEVEISGRASLHLVATEKQLSAGIVEVKGLNLAYFHVPQSGLSGGRALKGATGSVGFAVNAGGRPQYLDYDPRSGVVSGEVSGYVDAGFMGAMVRPKSDEEGTDTFDTPKQEATLHVEFQLDEPISALNTRAKQREQDIKPDGDSGGLGLRTKGAMRFDVEIEPEAEFDLPSYQIESKRIELELEYVPLLWFEVAKRLCLQPVRIRRVIWMGWPLKIFYDYTGEGLDFGMPQARSQWAKADVVFSVNEWVTLTNWNYWQVDTSGWSTSTEEANLLSEVNNDECVEVFFVDDFVPESAHGGGATWGSGTANAKIITSDGNARGGIDETHLAHELGHAMGLPHPPSSTVSTGTLMCPSGWMNDNPQVNSQQNKDNLSNPLFTFGLKLVSAGPDCQNSADCGPCP